MDKQIILEKYAGTGAHTYWGFCFFFFLCLRAGAHFMFACASMFEVLTTYASFLGNHTRAAMLG